MKFCLIVLILMCSVVNAQQQGDVIRVNTELVQTAVTVLDKKGNFVEGLQRDQFELMVDGKPRPVAFFERVASGSAREGELATLSNPNDVTAPRIPGRTIVFFIDDLPRSRQHEPHENDAPTFSRSRDELERQRRDSYRQRPGRISRAVHEQQDCA